MLVNLSIMSLSMSDIFGIDVIVIISSFLRINIAKILMDSEIILSIVLLFGRMFSLMKIFHQVSCTT